MGRWILKRLINIKGLKQILSAVRHEYLSNTVRQLGRENPWKAAIILKLQRFNLLQNLQLFLEALAIRGQWKLFEHALVVADVCLIILGEALGPRDITKVYIGLATGVVEFRDLEDIAVQADFLVVFGGG